MKGGKENQVILNHINENPKSSLRDASRNFKTKNNINMQICRISPYIADNWTGHQKTIG